MKTPEYLSRFSDPDYKDEQTRAISEMGNKIDFQRKFNFLIKELNGNNPSQDNAFLTHFLMEKISTINFLEKITVRA